MFIPTYFIALVIGFIIFSFLGSVYLLMRSQNRAEDAERRILELKGWCTDHLDRIENSERQIVKLNRDYYNAVKTANRYQEILTAIGELDPRIESAAMDPEAKAIFWALVVDIYITETCR